MTALTSTKSARGPGRYILAAISCVVIVAAVVAAVIHLLPPT